MKRSKTEDITWFYDDIYVCTNCESKQIEIDQLKEKVKQLEQTLEEMWEHLD